MRDGSIVVLVFVTTTILASMSNMCRMMIDTVIIARAIIIVIAIIIITTIILILPLVLALIILMIFNITTVPCVSLTHRKTKGRLVISAVPLIAVAVVIGQLIRIQSSMNVIAHTVLTRVPAQPLLPFPPLLLLHRLFLLQFLQTHQLELELIHMHVVLELFLALPPSLLLVPLHSLFVQAQVRLTLPPARVLARLEGSDLLRVDADLGDEGALLHALMLDFLPHLQELLAGLDGRIQSLEHDLLAVVFWKLLCERRYLRGEGDFLELLLSRAQGLADEAALALFHRQACLIQAITDLATAGGLVLVDLNLPLLQLQSL